MNENNPLVETEIINATQGPEYNDLEPAIKVDEPQLEIEPIPVNPEPMIDTSAALVSDAGDKLHHHGYRGLRFSFRELSGVEGDSLEGKAMQFDAVQLLEVSGLPEEERMKKLRDNGLKTTMSPEKKMLEKVYLMLVNWNLTKPRIGVNGKPLKEGDKVILDKLEISRENVHKLQKEVWESIKTFVQTVEDKLIGNAQIKN